MKKIISSLLVFVSVFSLAACGNAAKDNGKSKETTTEATVVDQVDVKDNNKKDGETTKTTSQASFVQGKFSLEAALEKALDEVKNGEVLEIKYEKEGKEWVYKFKIYANGEESKVVIKAEDGTIKKVSNDKEDRDADDKALIYADYKNIEEAYEAAMATSDTQDLELKSWSLEYDDGKFVYDFEFDKPGFDDTDIKVDAEDLTIIEIDR